MVGMCSRATEFSAIPVSERLYFHHLFRKGKYKHLYYCKSCVLNFQSAKPAAECSRCHGSMIVELHPRDFTKSQYDLAGIARQIKAGFPQLKIKKPAIRNPLPSMKYPRIGIPLSHDREELPTR